MIRVFAGLALVIAGGVWIYNIGMGGGVIDVLSIIPPAFLFIGGGLLIKS